MRRKLELLKLQIKSAFLSIPKIILGTIVTAVLVIAISTCVGIATAQDSDMRMKVAVVYPDYDDTENSDSADNKEFRYIKMAFNYVSEIDTIKNVCTFEYTDRQKAIDGLRNNYYVMAIIVPENMISDIMSGENTPVEVVCQSEGVNNTSMIFREMVRAGGSDLATAEAGIYTFDDLFNGVLKNYRGLRGTHENKLNDIYLSYALNRSIYFKTRDISVKEGLSTVQFYVCTAIVMLLLLSTITCAGNMKGESRSLAKSLKGAGISAFDTGIARTAGVGIVYIMIFEVLFIIINVMRLGDSCNIRCSGGFDSWRIHCFHTGNCGACVCSTIIYKLHILSCRRHSVFCNHSICHWNGVHVCIRMYCFISISCVGCENYRNVSSD